MKIKVRPDRLLSTLGQHGFHLGPDLLGQDSFSFVRAAKAPELFEWVMVEAQGKRSEAVYATVATSLTSIILDRRDLDEEHLLTEIDQDKENAWTIITSQVEAKAWEAELVASAPLRVGNLSSTGHGTIRNHGGHNGAG